MRKSLALQIPYNAAQRANGVIAFGFAVGAAVAFWCDPRERGAGQKCRVKNSYGLRSSKSYCVFRLVFLVQERKSETRGVCSKGWATLAAVSIEETPPPTDDDDSWLHAKKSHKVAEMTPWQAVGALSLRVSECCIVNGREGGVWCCQIINSTPVSVNQFAEVENVKGAESCARVGKVKGIEKAERVQKMWNYSSVIGFPRETALERGKHKFSNRTASAAVLFRFCTHLCFVPREKYTPQC